MEVRVKVWKPVDGKVRVKFEYRRVTGLGAKIIEEVPLDELEGLVATEKEREKTYLNRQPPAVPT
jgi:hypothetical protein